MNKVVLGLIGTAILFATTKAITCPADDGSGDSVYFPHETECGKFYECNAGKAVVLECPSGLYFDSVLDVCNWDVDCGNLLTSTAGPRTSDVPPSTDGPDEPETTEAPQPETTEAPEPESTTAEA